MFGKLSVPTLLVATMALGASACVEDEAGIPPPLEQLYFPTGIAITPEIEGQGQLLLVTSSNFDLRFRSGALHAFDVAAIDRLVEEAEPQDCTGGGNCAPVRVESFGDAFRGAVEIGSFAGEVGVGQLPGGGGALRAFVPQRGSDDVTAVDVLPGEGMPLRCTAAGEARCDGVSFPRPDPFSVVVAEGNVYIGHIGRDLDDDPVGAIGAARVDADLWSGGGGRFELIELADEPVGGIAAGACRDEDGETTCSLFATGRSFDEGINPVYLFDFTPDVLRSGPVFARNVYAQQRGIDTRGVAVGSAGNVIYAASRFPAAVATIDVTRLDRRADTGCVVPPGELVPPEGSCPSDIVPLDGDAEPGFVTADLVPLPPAPNAVRVIPRTLPDGTSSDLVIITTESGLFFYDTRTGLPAGVVEEVGTSPSAVAVRLTDEGARLYVPSFGFGTLAVVDIPDLLRPSTARVIAIVGERQEGAL